MMLIDFSLRNFRSVRNEQRLSLAMGKGKELLTSNVMHPKMAEGVKTIPLLRSSAVYGPNAAGKSNIIKALHAMQQIVLTSGQHLAALPVVPHLFNSESAQCPAMFEVIVLVDGIRYQYGFEATHERIHAEWLFAFPKGYSQRWFERAFDPETGKDAIEFGDKLLGDKEVWRRATRPNALLLSTAVQLNSQQLQPLFTWFANKLRVIGLGALMPNFTAHWCKTDQKNSVLNFLQAADFAIDDLRVEETDFTPDSLPGNMPDALRQFFESEMTGKPTLKLFTSHKREDGSQAELNFGDESDGTQKMFSFAGPWLDTLQHGRVLFIDELHDNLHPSLVQFLVQLFHNPTSNPHGAQLVFTTHETSILNQKVFRRDQIWFCERDKDQATRLYPLSDFKPRKGLENLERNYLSGRYGALPYLKSVTESFGVTK